MNRDTMRHDSKYTEKLLEISQRLELKREDMQKIIETNTNSKTSSFLNPANCYKANGSYYGTISINHFK